jgi:hypothetical protein
MAFAVEMVMADRCQHAKGIALVAAGLDQGVLAGYDIPGRPGLDRVCSGGIESDAGFVRSL